MGSRTFSHRWHLVGLVLIAVTAATLRLWQIDAIPPGFHFDESFEGLEAWRILTEPGYKPIFLSGNFGVPPLNAYANALTFAIFRLLGGEAGPTAIRVTAAIFGLLGVLAVLRAGRRDAPLRTASDAGPFHCWRRPRWPSCAGTFTSAAWASSR